SRLEVVTRPAEEVVRRRRRRRCRARVRRVSRMAAACEQYHREEQRERGCDQRLLRGGGASTRGAIRDGPCRASNSIRAMEPAAAESALRRAQERPETSRVTPRAPRPFRHRGIRTRRSSLRGYAQRYTGTGDVSWLVVI